MANKSSKSNSGEAREQGNDHIRKQEIEKKDIDENTGAPATPGPKRKQENLENRGYQEDQPHNPVRSSGSTQQSAESLPAGEPDKSDGVMKNNQSGPGLG